MSRRVCTSPPSPISTQGLHSLHSCPCHLPCLPLLFSTLMLSLTSCLLQNLALLRPEARPKGRPVPLQLPLLVAPHEHHVIAQGPLQQRLDRGAPAQQADAHLHGDKGGRPGLGGSALEQQQQRCTACNQPCRSALAPTHLRAAQVGAPLAAARGFLPQKIALLAPQPVERGAADAQQGD